MKLRTLLVVFGCCMLGWVHSVRGAEVRLGEERLVLPTYVLGEEDPNPPFPLVARSNIYPYTMLDDLTDRREGRTYRAIVIENEFLKATILPELGGRLYSLYDKVTGREVFYRNNVVKYGLVALRGAWISGGIEFNFPDGHTTVTVSPVAATARRNTDGSATVVVGDVDRVTGMHWEIALTLRPSEARLEQTVTLFNATPWANRYWYWANAAVAATPDMQFIYPMREVNPHVKGETRTYPVWQGVDWSWYRNIRQPTALFGLRVRRDFFGAYYHSGDYGVVHVADFHEVPGKKLWSWGVAGDGLIWTDLLTDNDGPYSEIQSGRFETQLTHEFMAPRHVESWTEYWYPVRGLGEGFVQGTPELALNVRFITGSGMMRERIVIIVSPTVAHPNLKVRAQLGEELVREFGPVALEPLVPRRFTLTVEDVERAKRELRVEVTSGEGKTLGQWSAAEPIDGSPDHVSPPGESPASGRSIQTLSVEGLYLVGLEQEKEGRMEAALATYERGLERDPDYAPILLRLAWRCHRSADFERAAAYVQRALRRDPANPLAHYAAGVIYRDLQRWQQAEDSLWESIRFGGVQAPALAQLGEIAIRQKKYATAVSLLERGLQSSPGDALLMADLAVALRLSGRLEEAARVVARALDTMPLLPFALAEQACLTETSGGERSSLDPWKGWAQSLSRDGENYLEVAAWYRSLGDLVSSDIVLQRALTDPPAGSISAVVYYYLAANARHEGRVEEARRFRLQAQHARHERVFPSRIADALVLMENLREDPSDGRAQYLLGNFLFAYGRYEEAARLWSQALENGFEHSVLLRNLGIHAWRVKKDLRTAAAFYERALHLAPNDFRLYNDLDEIYTRVGERERRAKLFGSAPAAVLERDTVRVRWALILIEQQRYAEALESLMDHHFKPWEGGVDVRQVYIFANMEQGKAALKAGHAEQAEEAFRRALEYPPHLGVGKPARPPDEEPLYWLGQALAAQGKLEAARAAWQQAASDRMAGEAVGRVFRALALRRLGKLAEAQELLSALIKAAREENAAAHDFYAAGLAQLASNQKQLAKANLRRALELNPSLWCARLELASLK